MDTITVHILQTGRVQVSPDLPFKTGHNPFSVLGLGSRSKRIWLPVSVYLVQTEHGNLLFDTGWGVAIRGDQKRYLHFPNYIPNVGDLPEGQELTTLLAGCGITPGDLDTVLFSHLDLDHASGLKEVAGSSADGTAPVGARRVLASREEWEAANASHVRYVKDMWEGVDVTPFDFEQTGYGPFGRSKDLYGDGMMCAVWLPGHTKGSTGLVIRNQHSGRFIILAGDCGYGHRSWEQLIQPGLAVDRSKLATSLRWLQTMSQDPRCIDILACHDTAVSPHAVTIG